MHDYVFKNGVTGCPAKIAVAFRSSVEKMPSTVSMIDPVKAGAGNVIL